MYAWHRIGDLTIGGMLMLIQLALEVSMSVKLEHVIEVAVPVSMIVGARKNPPK